jgi:hypothetical protein
VAQSPDGAKLGIQRGFYNAKNRVLYVVCHAASTSAF